MRQVTAQKTLVCVFGTELSALHSQDTGLSFDSPHTKRRSGSLSTPGGGGSSATPSKLLLMRGERQMNVLSPEAGSSLFQVVLGSICVASRRSRIAG